MEDKTKTDSLAGFPAIIALPVQWGDQDAYQHVNNTVYFRWCESSRIEYLGGIGLDELMVREHIGPILAAITCNYRSPVVFPDTVRIGARVTRLGRSSLTMEHVIESRAQGRIVAEATSTIVVFDYQRHASHPIPDELRRAIEKIEGKSFD
jgi:acyl-CoA thioester hydrolase